VGGGEVVFSRLDDAMPLVEGRPFPALTPGQRYEFDALGVSRPIEGALSSCCPSPDPHPSATHVHPSQLTVGLG